MTYRKAVKKFRDCILPLVKAAFERNFCTDLPARRQAWNDWTDALCKDGTITPKQYNDWVGPFG